MSWDGDDVLFALLAQKLMIMFCFVYDRQSRVMPRAHHSPPDDGFFVLLGHRELLILLSMLAYQE
jgi:hypothetical protein